MVIEKIACSALYYNDYIQREHMARNIKTGMVICGLRHCNCFATMSIIFPNREHIVNPDERIIQGFITTDNRFVDRSEGYKIALLANQIDKDDCNEILMSEDLY